MKSDRKSSHSPGAQGHGDVLSQIAKLEREHNEMMSNQALPKYEERIQDEDVTSRLYHEQAPRDYGRRKVTKYKRGENYGHPKRHRGDNGGREY